MFCQATDEDQYQERNSDSAPRGTGNDPASSNQRHSTKRQRRADVSLLSYQRFRQRRINESRKKPAGLPSVNYHIMHRRCARRYKNLMKFIGRRVSCDNQ